MSGTLAPPGPGPDDTPGRVPPWPDWMDDPAYLALRVSDEDPGDLDLDLDPEDAEPDVDEAEVAAGPGAARPAGPVPGWVGEPRVGIRVGQAAGRRAGLPGPGPVRGGSRRG